MALSIARKLETLNEYIGQSLAWLTLGMVIVTVLIVILRYFFNLGWIAMQESVIYMHACVFMLGTAYALKHNAHVRVDIFYQTFSARRKASIDLFGNLFLLMPICLFIFFLSFDYVVLSWKLTETSAEAGGLPYVYLLKTLIPAMAILLLLQAIANCLKNIYTLTTGQRIQSNNELDI